MITYSAFIESDTDITNLGFSTKGDFYPYYCTPKNARILGFAGTDGIHFCTVEKFGETVFAVSPMNFGNCVHPIAKNFEDFLRLLLSVADTAVLEQCCLWTKEQYDSFVSEFPATGDQTESLNILQNKFGIEPLGNPFEYVKELQAKFDYSAIPYTDDYFDSDMNPSLCKAEEMRNVYFEKGFWQKKNKGRPCSKIDVNKSFVREEKNWYVPAVYSCAKGFVVDFCIEVPSEAVKDFNARWIPVCESDNSISPETEEQVERENPLNADFTPSLILNGKEIKASQGSSLYWMSADCIPNGTENTRESEGIVKNYCLDTSKAWSVHRWSFPYPKANKAKIKKLNVNITQPPRNIKGICFSDPKPGSTVSFTHPLTNTDHEFTVIEYEKNEFSTRALSDEYEYPTHHTVMTYTLSPDIPDTNFLVRDIENNDPPRIKPTHTYEPSSQYDVCIGIIGGADGPTALIPIPGIRHAAISALHFEPRDKIEWQIMFREKLIDDTEIELIQNTEEI